MYGATQLKPSATRMAAGRLAGLSAQERELPLPVWAPGNTSMFSQPNNMAADRPAPTSDQVLSLEQWYPEFHRFHMAVVVETPDFDYGWIRQNRLELYQRIKAKENQIDALGAARLSQVMALLREWRELILRAEFERKSRRSF